MATWRRIAAPWRCTASNTTCTPAPQKRSRRKKAIGATDDGGWSNLGVPDPVKAALVDAGMHTPTEIQSLAITAALSSHCDIIGASETGSGKTLAFTLPILHHIVTSEQQLEPLPSSTQQCSLKVKRARGIGSAYDDTVGSHVVDLNSVNMCEEEGEEEEENEGSHGLVLYRDHIPDEEFQLMMRPPLHTAAARSTNDKTRPLTALILSPTRELALQIKTHIETAAKYTNVMVCVLVGGMAIEKQLRLLDKRPHIIVATPGRLWKLISEDQHPHLCSLHQLQFFVLDEADRMVEHGHFTELSRIVERVTVSGTRPSSCRTFIFSATLTLPRRCVGKGRVKNVTRQQTLESLMSQLGLSDSNTHIIDLTSSRGTVESLTETKLMCSSQEEKDVYLYYFLLAYPGRTVIFVNSVGCVHRLHSLFTLLNLQLMPLHSGLQQRQRLKNMDRFVSGSDSIMVATDVAARGLDIAQIQHVIHYHLPRNTEVYVHRSGRTARGRREGLSVALVGPTDVQAYRNICRSLNRDEGFINFPVNTSFFRPLRPRVQLAKRIELAELRMERKRRSQQWVEQTALAMDIQLDDDMKQDEDDVKFVKQQQKCIQVMKAELRNMLKKTAVPHGVSLKFPAGCGHTAAMDHIMNHTPLAISGGHSAVSTVRKLRTSV